MKTILFTLGIILLVIGGLAYLHSSIRYYDVDTVHIYSLQLGEYKLTYLATTVALISSIIGLFLLIWGLAIPTQSKQTDSKDKHMMNRRN